MDGKVCCFIGHRNVEKTPELKERLINTIRRLITENGVNKFLFGCKSRFDDLCQEVVTELREEYPELADRITVMLPDEKPRRVGQSVAAASLPEV